MGYRHCLEPCAARRCSRIWTIVDPRPRLSSPPTQQRAGHLATQAGMIDRTSPGCPPPPLLCPPPPLLFTPPHELGSGRPQGRHQRQNIQGGIWRLDSDRAARADLQSDRSCMDAGAASGCSGLRPDPGCRPFVSDSTGSSALVRFKPALLMAAARIGAPVGWGDHFAVDAPWAYHLWSGRASPRRFRGKVGPT